MLFSNIDITVQTKLVKPVGGTPYELDYIPLGDDGEGRKLYSLPSNYNIVKGLNPSLAIKQTRTYRPKVVRIYLNKAENDPLHLIIKCGGGYTRRSDGYFQAMKGFPKPNIIAYGFRADGEKGRIGRSYTYLLEPTGGCNVLRIVWAGFGADPTYIVIDQNKVYYCTDFDEAMNHPTMDLGFLTEEDSHWETLRPTR